MTPFWRRAIAETQMALDLLAVFAAAVASWIFGAVFYGALGGTWMAALGRSEAQIAARAAQRVAPVGPMIVSFVAELIMAATLAGLLAHLSGAPSIRAALVAAALVWLGFVVPALATNYAYQNAKPALTIIDSAHWLGVLLLQALVIAALG